MIEKVARALWDYNECGEAGLQWDGYEKGTMSDLQKQIHIDMAKAAIEAMREPTDKMILGWQDAQTCRDTYFDHDCYKAMIDATLKEE